MLRRTACRLDGAARGGAFPAAGYNSTAVEKFNYTEAFPRKKDHDELVGTTFNMNMFTPTYVPWLASLTTGVSVAMKWLGLKLVQFPDRMLIDRPREDLNKMRRVLEVDGKAPYIGDNCFIPPNGGVYGDVHLTRKNYIGYQAVVRGDLGKRVTLGESSHILEKAIVTGNTNIGKWVTIDCMATIDSADIGSSSYVGASAVVMKGARIESNCMLAASSVLRSGETVRSGEIWAGNPAQKVGDLTENEKEAIVKAAKHQVMLNLEHYDSWKNSWEDHETMRLSRETWLEMSAWNFEIRVRPMYCREPPGAKAEILSQGTHKQTNKAQKSYFADPYRDTGTREVPVANEGDHQPARAML